MNILTIDPSWQAHTKGEFTKPYFVELQKFLHTAYKYNDASVYPAQENIFRALNECAFDDVRVVILGQDPYHNEGQANGLAFSVDKGSTLPPSLQNIFKEIESDLGHTASHDGDLSRWAKQGVLLLNATLTVRAHEAGSHQGKGWEEFTDAVIEKLAREREGIVFLLWGAYAQRKGESVDTNKHLVLTAAHPSPLSAYRGFFGCKHFSKTNRYLKERGECEIEW